MKPPAPRVLWLPRWYPNKFDAFDGNFVEAHARVASEVADIAVLFVHSDPGLRQMFEWEIGKDPEAGFPVVRVYYRKPPDLPLAAALQHGIRFQVAQRIGYQLLKEQWGEPDLCHVHVLSRPAWLARKLKKPYCITEHASRYFPENPYFTGLLRRWWTRRVVRGARVVTTVSRALQTAMESHGLQGNYQRLSNVVRTDLFQPRESAAPPPWRLIHISTLHDNPKNTGGILRACARLQATGIEFHLDLLGDGPERARQEALSRELGLEDRVTFHGNVSLERVADKLAAAHLLVMFSWYETQSIVVLESLACGVPVVATAVGGLAEHLKPAFGETVAPGDEAGLAAAIQTVLAQHGQYDPARLRQYVTDFASPEAIRERFQKLYETTLS